MRARSPLPGAEEPSRIRDQIAATLYVPRYTLRWRQLIQLLRHRNYYCIYHIGVAYRYPYRTSRTSYARALQGLFRSWEADFFLYRRDLARNRTPGVELLGSLFIPNAMIRSIDDSITCNSAGGEPGQRTASPRTLLDQMHTRAQRALFTHC